MTEAEAALEAKRNDRRVLWCVAFIFLFGFAAAGLAYYMSLDDWAQEEADKAELAKWRNAAATCKYVKDLGYDFWEASCYNAAFFDKASTKEAQKLCQGVVAACDTTRVLSDPRL